MGFDGCSGNIAIETAIPPPYFIYYIVNIKQFMEFFNILFILACGFDFWMWGLTLAHAILFLLSAEHSAVMCGAWLETLVT